MFQIVAAEPKWGALRDFGKIIGRIQVIPLGLAQPIAQYIQQTEEKGTSLFLSAPYLLCNELHLLTALEQCKDGSQAWHCNDPI